MAETNELFVIYKLEQRTIKYAKPNLKGEGPISFVETSVPHFWKLFENIAFQSPATMDIEELIEKYPNSSFIQVLILAEGDTYKAVPMTLALEDGIQLAIKTATFLNGVKKP